MFVGGLDSLAAEIQERATQMKEETFEPLNTCINNYVIHSTSLIQSSHNCYVSYLESNRRLEASKEVYMI